MRHFYKDDAKDLKADKWMLDLLKLNPAYTSWGPYEDYMSGPKDGWSSPQFRDGWKACDFGLDDLNEVVNFYFEIERANKRLETGLMRVNERYFVDLLPVSKYKVGDTRIGREYGN